MSDKPPQLKKDHLKGMTPSQIVAARKEGLLDDIMSGVTPEPSPEVESEGARLGGADQGVRGSGTPRPFTRAWLQTLSPEEIVRRRRAGQLTGLMRGEGCEEWPDAWGTEGRPSSPAYARSRLLT